MNELDNKLVNAKAHTQSGGTRNLPTNPPIAKGSPPAISRIPHDPTHRPGWSGMPTGGDHDAGPAVCCRRPSVPSAPVAVGLSEGRRPDHRTDRTAPSKPRIQKSKTNYVHFWHTESIPGFGWVFFRGRTNQKIIDVLSKRREKKNQSTVPTHSKKNIIKIMEPMLVATYGHSKPSRMHFGFANPGADRRRSNRGRGPHRASGWTASMATTRATSFSGHSACCFTAEATYAGNAAPEGNPGAVPALG